MVNKRTLEKLMFNQGGGTDVLGDERIDWSFCRQVVGRL